MIRSSIIIISLGIILISCERINTYSSWMQVDGGAWHYNDSLEFKVDIPDSSDVYDIYINLEYLDSYRFRNGYFHLTTVEPGGEVKKELINVRFQENSGDWMGNCAGSKCKSSILLKPGHKFTQSGEYAFYLQQNMRKNPLRDIRSVGIRLERVN